MRRQKQFEAHLVALTTEDKCEWVWRCHEVNREGRSLLLLVLG